MYRILIVDDEKIERQGIGFLIEMENGEYEIYEAANGKEALKVLSSQQVDILLTDIKMPHMDGLDLCKSIREKGYEFPIVIFSGYSDFNFAQEAIRYGVSDYVLKPVDPEAFHDTLQKVQKAVDLQKNKEQCREKENNFLNQYFLQNYIYSGNPEIIKMAEEMLNVEEWNKWRCAIMVETGDSMFDAAEETLPQVIRTELHRNFFYLNLNARQSLLLFSDVYCDYLLVARQIYVILKREYRSEFYLSVSRKFDGYSCLPQVLGQLEQQMEEKFYHPDIHVFSGEDERKTLDKEVEDSKLMQKISEDISRKDVKQLWHHFECLKEKYQENSQFSAMYIKFVFSNVIQELFQEEQFRGERRLEKEIERLYSCNTMSEILEVSTENIQRYEEFINRSMSDSRDEVAMVKNYIYQHYDEDLSLEMLAEKVFLSSGYLSFIFKKETGMNLNRFIRVLRMEKAKELLCSTNMKVAQVSEKVGFANVSYFCRSFREYYGSSPESYRKGNGDDEENSADI